MNIAEGKYLLIYPNIYQYLKIKKNRTFVKKKRINEKINIHITNRLFFNI